jgi:XTP/dITP diphosphohydrolase
MSSRLLPTLLVATFNAGKIREIQSLVEAIPCRVLGLESLQPVEPSREDGNTFEANARQKAIYYSQHFPHLTLADDSGLVIDALGGQPGVNSARFVSASATDRRRCQEILRQLETVPDQKRNARFVCCLAVAKSGRVLKVFKGTVEGLIAREPRGKNGFGYDPIFLIPELGRTTAELTPDEKNRVSHRGEAMRKFKAWLESTFEREPE